jgi:hypothetical protein
VHKLHGVLQAPRYHFRRGPSIHAHFQCTCRGRNPHVKRRCEPSFVAQTCRGAFGLTLCSIGCGPTVTGRTKAWHTAWEKLDELSSHELCHDFERDRHEFGSYVRGQLPREHPHAADTTHDDRAEEGVYLDNDLNTPTFWLW